MKKLCIAFVLFCSSPALAQNPGNVAAGAFAIGKGPNVAGYTSLLCSAGQLAVGQAGAPICRTISGDATLSAAGSVTLASVIAPAGPIGSGTAVPIITYDAKGRLTAVGSATVTPALANITGLGTGVTAALALNIGSAGAVVVNGGALGTPSSGSGANLTALNASQLTSGIVPNARLDLTIKPEGRLTLTTGTPVIAPGANVTGATSVRYTPAIGNLIPIYDGTSFTPTAFTELTNVNANSATGNAGPAAVANNSCYDYFVWSNAGTPTLTRGPVWTNTSTRSAGTAIARTNGILLNTQAITNGPAANRGTYVGTACSNGTATFDWIYGGSGSGGVAGVLSVWNYYNRVSISTTVFDNGASYTYASGTATIRQARASAGNQVSFVSGVVEEGFTATVVNQAVTAATVGSAGLWGVGLNSTSAFACGRTFAAAPTAATFSYGASATCNLTPALGLNVISSNEQVDSSTTVTFNSQSLNNLSATLRL